jgi:hypothetical protein
VIVVEQSRLEAATSFVSQACDGMNPILNWCRLIGSANELAVIGVGDVVTAYRRVTVAEHRAPFDVCVEADRMHAAVKAMSAGGVRLELGDDGAFRVTQGDSLEVNLETKPATEFAQIPGFQDMKPVYAGPNPSEMLSSMKHVAAAHPGNTPIAEVVIMMGGRSYLAGTLSAMRTDGSLVAADQPDVLPVHIKSLWPLERLGPNLTVFHDPNRVLVCDEIGYVVLRKWAGDLGAFPNTVSNVFSSLRQVGQVKVGREDFLRAVTAANVVLKPLTKEEVFLNCVATKATGSMEVSAAVGRHSFREKLEAGSTGNYRIPIHVSRLLSFLKNSGDDHVFMQIMDSNVVPSPRGFVHMTDSRLHEAISIPKPREVQVDA